MKKIFNIVVGEGVFAMGGYDTNTLSEEKLQEIATAWNEEDNDPNDYYEVREVEE